MSNGSRLWLIPLIGFALFIANGVAQPQQSANRGQIPEVEEGKEFERRQWFYRQRAYPLNTIPEGAMRRALEQLERSELLRADPAVLVPPWTNIGPAPIVGGQIEGPPVANAKVTGRIRDIDIDPTNSNHWLIASDGGGVWETLDAGANWTPKTDMEIALSTGAVAFAPGNPNIIYAGVGHDSALGIGILKSSDGGNSWQLLGTSTFSNVGFFSFREIEVHPTNPNIVLVASWSFFNPEAATGIFKSTDGGATWSKKLAGTATEFEVDPGNFNNMYSGIRTESLGGNSSLNGVYRSTDAGETWQLIGGPWGAITNGGSSLEFAIAPSNHNVLYISFTRTQDGTHHWRTNDAWAPSPAWFELPIVLPAGFPNYQDSIVDPTNPDIFYVGGFPFLWRFTPGTGWTNVTAGTHVDEIALAWQGSRLLVGNDGGMWSTLDGGFHWTNHNANLSITQFYLGSLHPTDPGFALGGSQDNGTEKWTGNGWQFLFGGDGADSKISSSNPNTHWAISFQGLGIIRTTNGGASFTGADTSIDHSNAPFIARFEKCPDNDNLFIAGTDNLWRTNNFFNSGNPSWSVNGPEMRDSFNNPDSITAVAFGPAGTACNTYAYGTGSGQLRLTTDGGNNWRNIDISNAVPNRFITDLVFHPVAADFLYVTLSGFDQGTPGQPGHVFRTTNALSASPTWTNISPPVNAPHNAFAIDPSEPNVTLFAGSDLGVFKSTNDGGTWSMAGTGLPRVPVLDLQVNGFTNRIAAFTFGRGAFVLLPNTGANTTGLYDPGNAAFFLRNSNTGGVADISFSYGPAGAGFIPLVGDWDGDGDDTVGLYNPSASAFFLRNANSTGVADVSFAFGPAAGWLPLVGDWNGDGVDTVGLYDPATSTFFLRNSNSTGVADLSFAYGPAGAGWLPIVGDWDGNGTDTIALYNPAASTFFLRNSNTTGVADVSFAYGPGGVGWRPLAGDWDDDGADTIGLYNPGGSAYFLRNTNTTGVADVSFAFGPPGGGWTPLVGDWDGL